MSGGQLALAIIGAVAMAESSWGLASPGTLREVVRRATEEVPERNPGLAVFFGLLALGLWALMSPRRSVVDYALLFMCWIFAGGALVNLRRGGFMHLLSLLILDRPVWAIRLFYGCEFALACVLLAIGLNGT